jgi:site-specific DNA-methyltransferase (adenine-specific)
VTAQIYLGRWQDALAHVDTVDAIICDPPYGARTHEGHNALMESEIKMRNLGDDANREMIHYNAMTTSDVADFVAAWAPRCRGWFVAMTSHDLIHKWESMFDAMGRAAFAPVPIIQKRPRLVGDGPSSWAVYMMVSRPRNREFATWGCLPGAYEGPTVKDAGIAGTKPLDLMRAIVRDYSRPGDLVCDPFVGSGTTALACAIEGRRFIGAEEKREHYDIATKRLSRGFTRDMFSGGDGA